MLGPQIDEDNIITLKVSLGDALFHFGLIGWKLLFAIVPPVKWGGGFPAFIVALGMIGIITGVVGNQGDEGIPNGTTALGCTTALLTLAARDLVT